jgi:hypothetical protein
VGEVTRKTVVTAVEVNVVENVILSQSVAVLLVAVRTTLRLNQNLSAGVVHAEESLSRNLRLVAEVRGVVSLNRSRNPNVARGAVGVVTQTRILNPSLNVVAGHVVVSLRKSRRVIQRQVAALSGSAHAVTLKRILSRRKRAVQPRPRNGFPGLVGATARVGRENLSTGVSWPNGVA